MTKSYEQNAVITIQGADATYTVTFSTEYRVGRTWEFDRMSDAIGQNAAEKTGNIKIVAEPEFSTMKFPEDCLRQNEFVVKRDMAASLYMQLQETLNYWFFLDMCSMPV